MAWGAAPSAAVSQGSVDAVNAPILIVAVFVPILPMVKVPETGSHDQKTFFRVAEKGFSVGVA